MDVTEEILIDQKIKFEFIDEGDDLPIAYVTPDEWNVSSENNIKLTNAPRAIVTTEEDFNLNGFIFESDIKVENETCLNDLNVYSPPSYECNSDDSAATVMTELKQRLKKDNEDESSRCRKRVSVKIKKLSGAIIEKYSNTVRGATCNERIFKCDICGHCASAKSNLKNHMITHIREKTFACSDCPKKFSTMMYLQNHQKLHRAKEYKCELCLKTFWHKDSLNYHLKTHIGDKKFNCEYCSMRFLLAHQLRIHRRKHTGERPYQCTNCDSKFKTYGCLQTHDRTHSDVRSFICDYDQCSKSFKTRGGLMRHKRRHRADKNVVACKNCSKKFFSAWRLSIHQRTHTGERPYSCKFCSKSFTEKNVLENHERSIHTEEKPFACTQCSSKFARLSTLIDHRRTHSDERPHGCDACQKTFKSRPLLRSHKIMHREKKYSCDRCSIKFREIKSWSNHQRTDGNETDLFKCKYCDKRTAFQCVHKEHMKTHLSEKRFSCTVCEKLFSSNSLRNKHSRIHLDVNQRRYACSYCTKKFYTKAMQTRHELTHTGVKPYKCDECTRTFSRLDSLKGHMQRIHFIDLKNEPKNHRQQKPVQFECYICRLNCAANLRRLMEHLKNH